MNALLSAARESMVAADHRLDPAKQLERLVEQRLPLAAPSQRRSTVDELLAGLFGLGALQRLVNDPAVTELMVNNGRDVWIERDGQLVPAGIVEPDELAAIVERLLAPLGLRLDRSHPVVDARLADGSRVCIVAAPVAPDGTTVAIRRFGVRKLGLAAFGDADFVHAAEAIVGRRLNAIVTGPTSSGKTTMLNSLGALLGSDRVVTIEDTAELQLDVPNLVRLECRPETPDGVGAVTMTQLLRAALRLRPDRIVVGEVRGEEAAELLHAMNTGHDGSLGTLHANSAADALARFETLVQRSMPTWPHSSIRSQIRSALDVVVHVRRGDDGKRCVGEVVELDTSGADQLTVRTIWTPEAGLVGEFTRRRR